MLAGGFVALMAGLDMTCFAFCCFLDVIIALCYRCLGLLQIRLLSFPVC